MKVLKYLLFVVLLSFISITTYAKETINIKSIVLDSKSETATINSEPTFSGLEMNYDISFEEVGDFAKYKIVIENNTNKSYKVSEDTSFKISEYVTYNYESDHELKPNTTSEIYVIIKYSKAVEKSVLDANQGKYSETNKAVLQMTDENNKPIENPKTGTTSTILLIIFIMILSFCITVIINKEKPAVMMSLVALCLIPLTIFAVETLKLTINVKIDIRAKPYKVIYVLDGIVIKADDADKYDLSKTTCVTTYVNSISEENKYYECAPFYIEDQRTYQEGETVNMKEIEAITILGHYTRQPDGTFLVEGRVTSEIIEEWNYESERMEELGYSTLPTDKETMNFNGLVEDHWEESGKIILTIPVSFKMPAHDVLFFVPIAA